MLRRVALVRTDVSEEVNASIIRVTRIGELGTTLAATSNRRTLRRNTKTSNLTERFKYNSFEEWRLLGCYAVWLS
jgi:DNA-binding TFAR19-related protein (PDSD5 family)